MKDTVSSKTAFHAPIHISECDARAGSTPHVVRYILAISLFLAIVAMSLAWIVPALISSEQAPHSNWTTAAP